MKKDKTAEKNYQTVSSSISKKNNWQRNLKHDYSLTIINNGNINLNNQNFTNPCQHPDHSAIKVEVSSDEDSPNGESSEKTKFQDVSQELTSLLSQKQVEECTRQKVLIARFYLWLASVYQLIDIFLLNKTSSESKLVLIFLILSLLGILFTFMSYVNQKINLVYLGFIVIHVNFVLILIFHGVHYVKMETQDIWNAKQTTYMQLLLMQQVVLNQIFSKKVSVPFSVMSILAYGVSQKNQVTWGQTIIQCVLWAMLAFGPEMGWLCNTYQVLKLLKQKQYLIQEMKKQKEIATKQQPEKTTDVAERRLLTIINATLSHDMRNPINSIYSQNVLQFQLNQQINQIIKSNQNKSFIKKLNIIHEQLCESVNVQYSSTQILSHMVNDLIDFGQIKSGNFSSDCLNSDIIDTTEEVLGILQFKAQLSNIKLTVDYKGFPLVKLNEEFIIQKNSIDYIINIDCRRFKQILLNLLSNAIKFSSPNSCVEISCNYIAEANQLKSTNFASKFRKPGMLEVSVKDRGIGIREKDQEKLFKMFEFIDADKELTTQGVGLGLHISKLIAEQLGGDIECKSVWQEGTEMRFLIGCEEKRDGEREVKRIKNPVGIRYPKFVLNVQQFESPEIQRKQTNMALETLIYSIQKAQNDSKSDMSVSFPLLKNCSINSQTIKKIEPKAFGCNSRPDFRGQTSSYKQNLSSQIQNQDKISNSSIEITVNSKQSSSQLEIIDETDRRGQIQVWEVPQSPTVTEPLQKRRSNSVIQVQSQIKQHKTMNLVNVCQQLSFSRNRSMDNEMCQEVEKRILIVDDEYYNIMGLKVLMTQASNMGILRYIDQATSGQEAVRLVRNSLQMGYGQTQYGMIFMDLSMPVMNGYETTDQIRNIVKQSNCQQPKIIACTGHTEEEFIIKAWHHRIDEFVMKPTKIEVLESIIKESIQFNHLQ